MKRKLILLITIFTLIFTCSEILAQEESVDVSQWNYLMLVGPSDQDEKIKINMFYSMLDKNKRAFCIEPKQAYKPKTAVYTRSELENENIFEIVKAYEKIGLENNDYYVAAQLMIWEELTEMTYSFDGNDYSKYKDEIQSLIDENIKLKSSNINQNRQIVAYLNEKQYIKEDFSGYEAISDDVEIISNDKEGLSFIVKNEYPEYKTIKMVPINNDEDNMMVLRADTSQDIYYFNGEYSDLKPFEINVKTLKNNEFIDIKYSKKDENGKNIAGAEFSVYEVNTKYSDEDIVLIRNGVEIDLIEALLDNASEYSNLRIETSERYNRYLSGTRIKTDEIGYFPYKILDDCRLIKEGICYVSNNIFITGLRYRKYATRRIFKGYSEDLRINTITDLPAENTYLMCESEPKKGYIYKSEPCVLINGQQYNGRVYRFVNSTRKYNLKLIKESPEYIPLDGAEFNLKYTENGVNKEVNFKTGSLLIPREDENKYLIYRHETSSDANIIEFTSDYFVSDDVIEGKYYFYQSNENIVDETLLHDDYVNVVKGGFSIDNLPYSSSLTLQETKPPKGFMLDDNPIYHIDPDIPYSEITFKNYRVNNIDIIPEKAFKIPETCVN